MFINVILLSLITCFIRFWSQEEPFVVRALDGHTCALADEAQRL
jgi:hypothetical protein